MTTLQFPLNIRLNATRPIFRANICGKRLVCMLDTGAHIPVFLNGEDLFNVFIHNLVGVNPYKNIPIGGFGKVNDVANVYNFDEFCINDKISTVCYLNCKVAVLKKSNIPCDFILPMSLFMKSRIILNCIERKQTLTIECERDKYGVGYYSPKDSLYIFSQQ